MIDILKEEVSPEDLRKFEKTYHKHLHENNVTPKVQFEYAWCLVRSKYSADISKGVILLEELFETHPEGKRDYLYYLIIGYARLKQSNKALKYCSAFLSVEPGNQQVKALEQSIKDKVKKDGLVGVAVAGGVLLAAGALVGFALSGKGGKSS
ncbi:mitochondrial fission 1 protein [Harmonia axyridis]|uniref:mitochondrial fission 1 protein n=1 Tax=Harmonia axyridis TaxID=115357 RepID=UPI001E277B73|nr:mitochondrial fission 1 protein [Harmonia axyridis]